MKILINSRAHKIQELKGLPAVDRDLPGTWVEHSDYPDMPEYLIVCKENDLEHLRIINSYPISDIEALALPKMFILGPRIMFPELLRTVSRVLNGSLAVQMTRHHNVVTVV